MSYAELVERMSLRQVEVNDSSSPLAHPQLKPQAQSLGDALNDYPCGTDAAVDAWLKQPAVATALHVNPNTKGMKCASNPGRSALPPGRRSLSLGSSGGWRD